MRTFESAGLQGLNHQLATSQLPVGLSQTGIKHNHAAVMFSPPLLCIFTPECLLWARLAFGMLQSVRVQIKMM